MGKKERGQRGKGAQIRHAKKTRKDFKDLKDAVDRIGTHDSTFILKKQRVTDDFEGHFMHTIPLHYTPISHGRVAVQDKESRNIVVMAKFSPFSSMPIEECEEIQKLIVGLLDSSKRSNKIVGNVSHKGGEGSMFALGWRAGYDKDLSFGRYMPSGPMKKSDDKLRKWCDDQEGMASCIADFYRTRFSMMASKIFDDVLKDAQEAGVPDFSQTEFTNLEQKEGVFASNLTFTFNNFSNSFHKDKDFNTYTYGIWFPLITKTGELAIIQNGSNFECTGGQFVVPSYKFFIDFSQCDGITEVIWRGKMDFHGTMPCECLEGFTRLGSFVQINQHLVFRLWKLIRDEVTPGEPKKKVQGME